jgi:hypothetical protein
MISLSLDNKTGVNENGSKYANDKLILTLSSLRLCISVDYAVFLYDFFAGSLPSSNVQVLSGVIGDELTTKSVATNNQTTSSNYEFYIENPQVLLVEDQLDIENTNTFILDVSLSGTLRTFSRFNFLRKIHQRRKPVAKYPGMAANRNSIWFSMTCW